MIFGTDSIGDAVINFLLGLIEGGFSIFPEWTAPDWLTDTGIPEFVNEVFVYAEPVLVWVAFDVLAQVAIALFALWLTTIVVYLILKAFAMIRGGAS
jgi:hypothetical protein